MCAVMSKRSSNLCRQVKLIRLQSWSQHFQLLCRTFKLRFCTTYVQLESAYQNLSSPPCGLGEIIGLLYTPVCHTRQLIRGISYRSFVVRVVQEPYPCDGEWVLCDRYHHSSLDTSNHI